MNISIHLSHVALLVPSANVAAEYLQKLGYQIGPAEEWEGEGTKEIYIQKQKANPLLLMEPVKPGAYRRAMQKRGPGLHHVAIDVPRLEEFLLSLSGSGWFLHLNSVRTMPKCQTAYLARPGFPALIEVQEKSEWTESAPFVSRLEIPFDKKFLPMIAAIGMSDFLFPARESTLVLDGRTIRLSTLLGVADNNKNLPLP